MTDYVVYADDGAIMWFGNSSLSGESLAERHPANAGTLLVVDAPITDQLAWRVVDGALVPRSLIPAVLDVATLPANGLAAATLTGLPEGAIVTVVRQAPGAMPQQAGPIVQGPVEVNGGAIGITSAVPGRLRITVTAGLAYAPWTGFVDAT